MPKSGLVGRIDAQLSLPLAFIGKPSILRRLNGRISGGLGAQIQARYQERKPNEILAATTLASGFPRPIS